VLEYLETIPRPGTTLLIAGYPIEIVRSGRSAIKTARINPLLRRSTRPSRVNAD